MKISTVLNHRLLVLALGFALVCLSARAERVEAQSIGGLKEWRQGLESPALHNCKLSIEVKAYERPNGKMRATLLREIYRRGDWYRRFEVGQGFDGSERTMTSEKCVTKQILQIKVLDAADPADPPSRTISGYLDVNELDKHPTDDLLYSQLLFGLIPMGGDWTPRLAMLEPETAKDNTISHELEGELGSISMTLSPDGLPMRIEHRANHYSLSEDNRFDPSRRDPNQLNMVVYSEIEWNRFNGTLLPQSYVMDYMYKRKREPTQYFGHYLIKLVDHELGLNLNDRDFLPTLDMEPGTPVSVSDVPVACEWRNDRIQPILPGGFGSVSLYFENGPLARVWSLVLLLTLIIVAGVVGWRYFKS